MTCTSSKYSVAEHLLGGVALLLLLLGGCGVALGWIWTLTLGLLRVSIHVGNLAALSSWNRPPSQSWRLQLVANRVDQSGEVDEVGHGLGCCTVSRTHRLRDKFRRSVVEHGGAADGIEGDGEDGVIQGEGPIGGGQVAHGYRLQAGELGLGMAGDWCDGDVGQSDRAARGGS